MAAEGGVGHALELAVRIDRRARQFDRYGQPPPRRGDRSQGYQKKRQWGAKRNQFRSRKDSRLAGMRAVNFPPPSGVDFVTTSKSASSEKISLCRKDVPLRPMLRFVARGLIARQNDFLFNNQRLVKNEFRAGLALVRAVESNVPR